MYRSITEYRIMYMLYRYLSFHNYNLKFKQIIGIHHIAYIAIIFYVFIPARFIDFERSINFKFTR